MTTRERMERRLERREEWGDKARAASAAHFQAAHDTVKDIPLGQPILVGHHSERRHRRTLERAHAAGMRGVGYQLSNLGGRIAADRKRLEFVRAQRARAAAAELSDSGVSIKRAGDGTYVRVTFAEKPARSVLDALKAARFCWRGGSWIGRADALPACVERAA